MALRAGVELRYACCLTCGHLWTHLPPRELRAAIKYGTEVVKQHVETLVAGPYHDVPELPAAREAAEKAAEIDALFVVGKLPEATRRYRELTGCTWDQAVAAIRGWQDLKRLEKLAQLGWYTKEMLEAEKSRVREHPMHDLLVDG